MHPAKDVAIRAAARQLSTVRPRASKTLSENASSLAPFGTTTTEPMRPVGSQLLV
jgi:hypothetical protein